jgi:hypothetical protein
MISSVRLTENADFAYSIYVDKFNPLYIMSGYISKASLDKEEHIQFQLTAVFRQIH